MNNPIVEQLLFSKLQFTLSVVFDWLKLFFCSDTQLLQQKQVM